VARTEVQPGPSFPHTRETPRGMQLRQLLVLLEPAWPAGCALLAVVSFWLWARVINDVNPRQINDLGLVSVLPAQIIFAFLLLTVSFCLLLHRRPVHVPTALLHVGLLVVMLYGMTSFIEEVPRFAVSWRHAGVADYIVRHGSLNSGIDAYFNWPGFFALAALFTELSGYKTPIALAAGAPIYFNLLYVGGVAMIMRAATSDTRVVWLGTWVFLISNWVGQDYFSPQAFSYFIHLMVLGLLLTWFRRERYRSADGDTADTALLPSGTSWQRVGLLAVAILLFASVVPTHQLTPFATVGAVLALVLFGRTTARGLPVLMSVLLVTWIAFAAVAFLSGHLTRIASDVGNVSGNTSANVSSRLTGSADHLFVLRVRLMMTAGLWGLALLGATRRLGRGHRDLTYGLLALSPFPLLLMQGYGGEMLLRVYLFSLPFVAFFVAVLFYPSLTARASWVTTTLAAFVCIAILGAFLYARFGNEKVNQFTEQELQVVDQLYRVAPKGALLVAGSVNVPWRSQGYNDYRYVTMTKVAADLGERQPRLRDLLTVMKRPRSGCSFVIFSRSQRTYTDLLGIWPPGTLTDLERQVFDSPLFAQVYSSDDATIYRLDDSVKGAPGATTGVAGSARAVDCRG
jgi:hypothetical protein